MTLNIRTGALVKAVRAQAAAKPSHRYTPNDPDGNAQCEYVTDLAGDPKPGCIVGAALLSMGVPVETFKLKEGKYNLFNEMPVRALLTALNKVLGYSTNAGEYPQDMEWLREVQDYQDMGYKWSEAVAKADAAVTGEDEA